MQITTSHEYAASPDEVATMLVDPAFLEQLASRVGAQSATVSAEERRASLTLTLNTPSAVKAVVGSTMTLTQVMEWDEPGELPRRGQVEVTAAGLPISMKASGTLTPGGAGTIASYEGELTVSIPIIGRKLEQTAEPLIREALDRQAEVGRDWLAERHSTK